MQVERYYNSLNHTISYGYNTLIKTYANGEKKIKYTTYSILKGLVRNKSSTSNSSSEYQEYKNLYKSKQNLIDLAYHNSMIVPWKYFVTLEFNANEIDYKDYSQVSSLLQKFTNNLKHQNPNLRYLIVPELHPNTGGIHFHGLLADCPNLKLVEAKSPRTGKPIYKNGCKIYNIKNYKYGFTTASEVKGQEQVSVYLSKYMTKTLTQIS